MPTQPQAPGTTAVEPKVPILTAPTNVKEAITFRGFKLNVNITATTSKETVLNTVNSLCEAISANDVLGERMRLTLGRLMAIVQDRRFYAPEFKRFEEYRMHIAERYRLSRSTVTAALGIARSLPTVEPADAAHVPLTNLTLLARAARHVQTTTEGQLEPDRVKTLLKDAETKSLKQFRQDLEKEKLIPTRQLPDPGVIIIRTTARMADAWKGFVGDKDPAEVLAELISYSPAEIKPKIRRR